MSSNSLNIQNVAWFNCLSVDILHAVMEKYERNQGRNEEKYSKLKTDHLKFISS